MQKADHLQGKWWRDVVFLVTALLVVVADQLSKIWIRINLAIGESIFELGFFRLSHVRNTGAAFGLFRGYSSVLTVVALIGVVTVLVYALVINRRFPLLGSTPAKTALGLVLGGTVGNLVDRIYFGDVTDFIDFNIWPAFNVADSAIVVGIFILAYYFLRISRAEKHSDGRSI